MARAGGSRRPLRRPPPYPCGQRPTPTGSFSRSRSIAHSNIERVAGWGLLLRPLGLTGSSAMNSAQENSDCCGSSASSWCPLPPYPVRGRLLTGTGAWPLPLAL